MMNPQFQDGVGRAECTSSLFEILQTTAEMGPEGGLDKFVTSLNPEWIEQALVHTGKVTLRRRRLPAPLASTEEKSSTN